MKEKRPNLLEEIKYVWYCIRTDPFVDKVKPIPYSDKWLMKQFLDDQEMIVIDSELGEGIKDNKYVKAFMDAVNRGKKIDVICGPKILVDESKQNKLFDYLFWKSYKLPNLNMWGIPVSHIPLKHFIANGRNILVESLHYPSEISGNKYAVENSLLWNYESQKLFEQLRTVGTIPVENLERLTLEQMKDWEKSPEFSKQREEIEYIKEASKYPPLPRPPKSSWPFFYWIPVG